MSQIGNNRSWSWEVPEYFNIGAACTDIHLGTPLDDQTAMIVEDDRLGTSTISFAQLARRSSQFARLLQLLQVLPGERVLVRLPNSIDYPITFLGTMKSGAIAVPSSTLLVAEEVRYLAQNSAAVALVTHRGMWSELSREMTGLEDLRHVILTGEGALPEATQGLAFHDLENGLKGLDHEGGCLVTRANDPAYLVYTSGTTGHPKGVLHAHRALIGRTPAASHWFDFHRGDRILHSGKLNWTYALGTGLMDPLYHGKTVVVHEGHNDAATWPRLIAKHRCTIFIGVPAVFRQILQKTAFTAPDVPTLRHCMSAGEHLSDQILHGWRARFGLDIYQALGMSECSYYISQQKGQQARPGSSGMAQPGHEIQILDAELKPVPAGVEGMICIPEDDPGLFLRYWNLDRENRRVRRGGWFLTGDYARKDQDGFVWYLGRRDEIINSFGYRVSPHEIERVMKGHAAVGDCVAIGQEIGGEKTLVSICIVLTPGCESTTKENLLAYGALHLAAYKRPRLVHLMREFPRTKNGKIIRRLVKQQVSAAADEFATSDLSLNRLEQDQELF